MIVMSTVQQFADTGRAISNLDRCTLCGRPRSVHGIDWTCSPGRPVSGARTTVLAVIGGLLTLAAIAAMTVTSRTETSVGTLAATGLLTGVTLLVCGLIIAGRRH